MRRIRKERERERERERGRERETERGVGESRYILNFFAELSSLVESTHVQKLKYTN